MGERIHSLGRSSCRIALLASALAAAAAACDDDGAAACRAGADCASGVCRPDGTCAPVEPADAALELPGPDAGEPADAGAADASNGDASAADAGGWCSPNHDWKVERREMVFAAGLHATFRIATDAGVATEGEGADAGSRVWDLRGGLPGDRTVKVETLPVAGQWFAGSFPGATYAAPLSEADETLGVFQATDAALLLMGLASPADGPKRTLLVYEHPIKILSFPIEPGATWSGEEMVSGDYDGVSYVCTIGQCTHAYCCIRHSYVSTVDSKGVVRTPLGDFEALRVRVEHAQQYQLYWAWWTSKTTRTFTFVSECMGTVASMASHADEPEVEFDNAAEVRRLSP